MLSGGKQATKEIGDKVADVGDKVQSVDEKVQVVIDGAQGLFGCISDLPNIYTSDGEQAKLAAKDIGLKVADVGVKIEDVGDKLQCVDEKVQVVIHGAQGLSCHC